MEASALHAPSGIAARNRGSLGLSLLRLRSDEQLVELFRAGDDDAFRVIHDRYRARLFAYARQMLPGSSQDAEDALQDVFMRAYSGLRANDRHVALRAWLYRVAHNRCIDQLRKPPAAIPLDGDELHATHSDPILAAEQRETLRRLILDVQRLPEQQRSALLMRELSGMSYTEMSDALDTSVPAVKSLLVRARVGLAAAEEARETDCAEIREELVQAHDQGIRPGAMARRHLRDCAACREFRGTVRGTSRQLAAIVPALAPLALVGKLLGLGGGAAAAGGGGAGTAGATGAVSAASTAGAGAGAAGAGAGAAGAGVAGAAGAGAAGVAGAAGAAGAGAAGAAAGAGAAGAAAGATGAVSAVTAAGAAGAAGATGAAVGGTVTAGHIVTLIAAAAAAAGGAVAIHPGAHHHAARPTAHALVSHNIRNATDETLKSSVSNVVLAPKPVKVAAKAKARAKTPAVKHHVLTQKPVDPQAAIARNEIYISHPEVSQLRRPEQDTGGSGLSGSNASAANAAVTVSSSTPTVPQPTVNSNPPAAQSGTSAYTAGGASGASSTSGATNSATTTDTTPQVLSGSGGVGLAPSTTSTPTPTTPSSAGDDTAGSNPAYGSQGPVVQTPSSTTGGVVGNTPAGVTTPAMTTPGAVTTPPAGSATTGAPVPGAPATGVTPPVTPTP